MANNMITTVTLCKKSKYCHPRAPCPPPPPPVYPQKKKYRITARQWSCGNVMFSRCLSVNEGVSLVPCPFWRGWVGIQGAGIHGRVGIKGWVCPGGGYFLSPDKWDMGYYWIRSTNGRYSSYWNSILFSKILTVYIMSNSNCDQWICVDSALAASLRWPHISENCTIPGTGPLIDVQCPSWLPGMMDRGIKVGN